MRPNRTQQGQTFPILIQKIDAERVGGSRSVVTALANRTRQSASLQFGEFLQQGEQP